MTIPVQMEPGWQANMTACPTCRETQVKTLMPPTGPGFYCLACYHQWRSPLVQPVNYQLLGTAKAYDQQRAASQKRFLGELLARANRIFELGCGAGSLARWLKSDRTDLCYHGLEVSPQADQARQVLGQVWSDWPSVQREAGHYDLVIASHVLEHLANLDDVMAALCERLLPSASLFVEVPNRSGHPALAWDTNPGHLHFFSSQSLGCLLARFKLCVVQCCSGAFESMRYPDSLRVLARFFSPPQIAGNELLARLSIAVGDRLVVWGAGGMARELLVPFFPTHRISCFLDKNPELAGSRLASCPIYPPQHLAGLRQVVLLISSVDYDAEIRAEIARNYADSVCRIVSLNALLATE